MKPDVDSSIAVTHACVILHNYLKDRKYSPPGFMYKNDASGVVVPRPWSDINGGCVRATSVGMQV